LSFSTLSQYNCGRIGHLAFMGIQSEYYSAHCATTQSLFQSRNEPEGPV
jgi:hypothetical protein